MGDEIKDANVVRLWHDPDDGKWHGRIGPDDGRGLTTVEKGYTGPCGVLVDLAVQASVACWPFDPTAPGPVIESGAER